MRPEFLSSPENEPDTISLVKAVADTFDNVAAGPTHTPALYAIFLRALISARTDPDAQPQQQQQQSSLDQSHSHNSHNRASNNNMHDSELANGLGFGGGNQGGSAHGESAFTLPDFQFTGEMGPVADLSVFPPTMASRSSTDGELAGLSMDHILSGGFWDNVLVPGAFMTFRLPPNFSGFLSFCFLDFTRPFIKWLPAIKSRVLVVII